MTNAVQNRHAINENHLTTPSTTQEFPLGLEVDVRDANKPQTNKKYMYVIASAALSQYSPYMIDHSGGGTGLQAEAPATGAARIGVPQELTWALNSFGFIQIEGDATVRKHGVETSFIVGDHVEVLNAATTVTVDGDTGSTVQTVNTVGVITKSSGSSAQNIEVYLFGDKADIASS